MKVTFSPRGVPQERLEEIAQWYNETIEEHPSAIFGCIYNCSAVHLAKCWNNDTLQTLPSRQIGWISELSYDEDTKGVSYIPKFASDSELTDRRLVNHELYTVSILMNPCVDAKYPVLGFVLESNIGKMLQ